jgi:LacI family transcriptional regulator
MDGGSRGRGRPTLATIAATAGVSVATVSKVLNDRSDVAVATRARVQQALQQQGYLPPAPRRVLTVAEQPTVELAFDGELHAYSAEIVQGVIDAGAEAAVAIVVSSRAGGPRNVVPQPPAAWARHLSTAGRRALIAVTSELTAGHIQALDRAKVPLVLIDPLNHPRARVVSVGATNFAGGLTATQHLLDLGHRRIGYVGAHPSAACNQARMHGFRAAMEGAGQAVPTEYISSGRFLYEYGLTGGSALLDLAEPPTAIFAGSDELALGVIEAARMRGLHVPEDLSVVGFDDTQLARMTSPPLTTVRQPLWEMGGVALRTALRLAAGETIESHHVELATRLVVRGSTAPLGDYPDTGPAGVEPVGVPGSGLSP